MTTTPITAEERTLRARLDESVQQLNSTLGACPAIDDVAFVDPLSAATVVERACSHLADAFSLTEALENLREASQEAIVLAATSRTALGVVREVLTMLSAAIAGYDAA